MLGLMPVVFRDAREESWWRSAEGVLLLEGLMDEVLRVEGLGPLCLAGEAWVREACARRGLSCLPPAPLAPGEDPHFPGSVAALAWAAGTPQAQEGVLLVNFRFPLTTADTLSRAVERFHAGGARPVCSATEAREHPCQSVLATSVRDAGLVHLLAPETGAHPGRFRETAPFPANWRRYHVDAPPGTLLRVADNGQAAPWTQGAPQPEAGFLLRCEAPERAALLISRELLDAAPPAPGLALLGCARPHGPTPPRLLLWGREGAPPLLTGSVPPGPGPGWLHLLPFGPEGPQEERPWLIEREALARGAFLPRLPRGCQGLAFTAHTPPVDGVHDTDVHTRADNLWGHSPLGSPRINLRTGNAIHGRNDFLAVFDRSRAFAVLGPEALPGYDWARLDVGALAASPLEEADPVAGPFDILRCAVTRSFRRDTSCPDGLLG